MATFDPQAEEIIGLRQKQALAQKLRESSMQPNEGKVVSGWYVPESPWTAVAQGLGAYRANKMEKEAEDRIKAIGEEQTAKRNTWLNEMPTTTEKQVGMEGSPTGTVGVQQKPTAEQYLGWATRGMTIDPSVAQMGMHFSNLSENRAAREAELKAKTMDAKLSREERFQATLELEKQRAADRDSQIRLMAALRPPAPEPLVAVMGKDGNPVMLPRSQAGGMTPANAQTMGVSSPAQRTADAKDAMNILRQAAPLVNKATSSGIGAAADWTAGLFGYSPKSADIAADLKVLGGALVSKMPKMSGPQSDKDVALYKEMAGKLGDPTVPASQKRNAMQTLMELQAKYAGTEPEQLNFTGEAKSASDILKQADAIIGGGK